jgi:hypothetical protein
MKLLQGSSNCGAGAGAGSYNEAALLLPAPVQPCVECSAGTGYEPSWGLLPRGL